MPLDSLTPRPAAVEFGIGQLARRTGLSVATIRYYEAEGLVPSAQRRPSGHRVYGPQSQHTLSFIRQCRDLGFSLEQVRALLSLAQHEHRDCVQVRDVAQHHLDAVRTKLTALQGIERSLTRFVQACTETCVGGPVMRCTILQDLGAAVGDLPPAEVTRGCCPAGPPEPRNNRPSSMAPSSGARR